MATNYLHPPLPDMLYRTSGLTLGKTIINAVGFLYVFSAWAVMGVVGLSRVCLALAVLLVMLVFGRSLATGRFGLPRYSFLPLVFLFFVFASLFWASDVDAGIDTVIPLASSLLGGLGVWYASELYGLSWRTNAWAIFLGSVVVCVTIVLQGGAVRAQTMTRLQGITQNPNQAATCLMFGAMVLWCAPVKLPRWMRFGSTAFVIYAILTTGSRKTILVLLGMAVMAVLNVLPKLKRSPIKVLLLASLLFASLFTVYAVFFAERADEMLTRFSSIGTIVRTQELLEVKDTSTQTRLRMILEGWDLWKQSPIVGHGAGQFGIKTSFGTYSHNNQIELLCCFGLVGFGLYYFLYVRLFLAGCRGALRGSARHLSAIAMLVTLLLTEMGEPHYYVKTTWILIPFIAYLVRPLGTEESRRTAVPPYGLGPCGARWKR